MKILHVVNDLALGGAQKLIEEFVPLMSQHDGIKVDVLLLTCKNNVFATSLYKKGINIEIGPYSKIRNPFNILFLRKFIKQKNYDVVHVHLFPSNYFVPLALKLSINKPKLVLTEHNTHNGRRDWKIFKYIEKFIYNDYDQIISISEETQNNLIEWLKPYSKNKRKFVVINNGINLKNFINSEPYKKVEINPLLEENSKLICMVGRFSSQKDQDTLIKAMNILDDDIHLLLIGDGPRKEENQKLAKCIGVENRVHFLGFRSDIDRLLKSSQIAVLSSHWEGFGLAAVEAMASHIPTIGTRVEGLKQIIADEDLIFNVGDVEQLREKVTKLLTNQEYYIQKANQAFKKSLSYDINKMVERYLENYKLL